MPPLPLSVVIDVEKIENYASGVIVYCGSSPTFNRVKASRVLCSAALQVLAMQIKHYSKLSGYCKEWQRAVTEKVISGIVGLLGSRAEHFEKSPIEQEVRQTLQDYLGGKLELAPTKEKTAVGSTVSTGTQRRTSIDAFLIKIAQTGQKIARKDIWIAAGYTNPTEFERFQRSAKPENRKAIGMFTRILGMEADGFVRLLAKYKRDSR